MYPVKDEYRVIKNHNGTFQAINDWHGLNAECKTKEDAEELNKVYSDYISKRKSERESFDVPYDWENRKYKFK